MEHLYQILKNLFPNWHKQQKGALNPIPVRSKCSWILIPLFIGSSFSALANYTVASGTNVNASTITAQTGVLTINGTLTLSSNTVLSGFTSVIINAPDGQIYWSNNSDLTF